MTAASAQRSGRVVEPLPQFVVQHQVERAETLVELADRADGGHVGRHGQPPPSWSYPETTSDRPDQTVRGG